MAKNRSCDCNCSSGSTSSSFIFGIILGAIIGAIIAVVIYRNNKNKVLLELKEKLSQYFNQFMKKAQDFQDNFSKETTKAKNQPKKNEDQIKESNSEVVAEAKPEITKVKKKSPKTFVRPKK